MTGGGTLPPIFQFDGGHDITLENMTLTGGGAAVNVVANSGSVDVTLQNLDITGFSQYGVDVGQGSTNFALVGGEISAPATTTAYGLEIDYPQAASVSGATFSGLKYGIDMQYVLSIDVSGDTFTNNYIGVNANYLPAASTAIDIDDNIVTGSTNTGLYLSFPYIPVGSLLVEGNKVSATNGTGIDVFGPGVVKGNTVSGGINGIVVSDLTDVVGNTVSDNSDDGIQLGYGAGITATMNTILDNGTGVYAASATSIVTNNLIYGSLSYGADIDAATIFDNNTIVQTGGIAILIETDAVASVENNIFDMTEGVVFTVPALDQSGLAVDQIGLASNYNLLDLQDGALMANWAGATRTAQGLTVSTFDNWMFGTGQDRNSLTGVPTFTNPGDATPVWGDFVLQPGSLGIAAGDPTSRYSPSIAAAFSRRSRRTSARRRRATNRSR